MSLPVRTDAQPTPAARARAVEALLRGDPIGVVARRARISEGKLRAWRREYDKGGRAQLERLASRHTERAAHHFVSYSHRDRRIAGPIFEAVRARGVQLWVDELALRGGSVWRTEIENAIRSAKTFVLLLSDHSALSPEVRREIDIARKAGKRIVPARVRPMDFPPAIKARMGDAKVLNLAQYRRERSRQLLKTMGEGSARLVRRNRARALAALAESHAEIRRTANRRVRAVKALLLGEPVDAVAARARAQTKTLHAWKREFRKGGRAQLGGVTMRENGRTAPHHFVSGSHRDRTIAGPILEELLAGGARLRGDDLAPRGDSIRIAEAAAAIRDAKTFVLLISPHSARSRDVRREIDVALEAGKDVVPVQIRSMRIPRAIMRLVGDTQILNLIRFRRERVGLLLEAMGEMDAPILPPHHDRVFRRNVERIAEALIPHGSTVILTPVGGPDALSYVQFSTIVAQPGDPLRGEAVGDRYRKPEHALSDEQKRRLFRLGWRSPEKRSAGNYWRDWSCTLDPERRTVAAIAIRTLVDVYGHDPERDVEIKLE